MMSFGKLQLSETKNQYQMKNKNFRLNQFFGIYELCDTASQNIRTSEYKKNNFRLKRLAKIKNIDMMNCLDQDI